MDNAELYNQDCMEVMKNYSDNHFDCCITSPPYNLGRHHHTGNKRFSPYKDDMPEDEYQDNQIKVLNELYRIMGTKSSVFYNHKNRIKDGFQISPYEWLLKTNWKVRQEIVWVNRSQNFDKVRFYPFTERIYWLTKDPKPNFRNNVNSSDVFKDSPCGTNSFHKRAFPLSLCEKLLMCMPKGSKVIEPYLGSGTVALAIDKLNKIEKMNLSLVGCELDEGYFNAACQRIKEQTAQQVLF